MSPHERSTKPRKGESGGRGTLTPGPTQGCPGAAIRRPLSLRPSVGVSVSQSPLLVPGSLLARAPSLGGIGGAQQAWTGFELRIARPGARSSGAVGVGPEGVKRGSGRPQQTPGDPPAPESAVASPYNPPAPARITPNFLNTVGLQFLACIPLKEPSKCARAKCPIAGVGGGGGGRLMKPQSPPPWDGYRLPLRW